MIKDLFDNLIKELQNEKNQETLFLALEPFSNKLKHSYCAVLFLIILIIGNLIYSNVLLSEIKSGMKTVGV